MGSPLELCIDLNSEYSDVVCCNLLYLADLNGGGYIKLFRALSEVYQFVFLRSKLCPMFSSPPLASLVDSFECSTISFCRVPVGENVYVVYEAYRRCS